MSKFADNIDLIAIAREAIDLTRPDREVIRNTLKF
jgi:hypothetical protein